jgi:hypothetical protein
MDDETGARDADEHAIHPVRLDSRELPARHAEVERTVRGEVDPAIGSKGRVVLELHARMFRREGVG